MTEKATLGAGCFWQVEVEFRNLDGVQNVTVGYSGGTLERPSYEDVCSGTSSHAEVVEVEFDPGQVSFEQILDKFWEIHDPTTLNRQGPDTGTQYRSVIFYGNHEQRETALASKEQAQSRFKRPIVTEIAPASIFWPAEDYHQRYLEKRGLATCKI